MAIGRDPLPSFYRAASKTITFTGGAGLGAVGTVAWFTVTGGVVLVREIVGRVTTSLTGATATISLATTSEAGEFIGATTATSLTTTNNLWASTTPTAGAMVVPGSIKEFYVAENIISTVATAAITAGVLELNVLWTPITPGATLS